MDQELLNTICSQLMDSAKLNLERDGELTPVAFGIYPHAHPNDQYPQYVIEASPLAWDHPTEKHPVHAGFVQHAKQKGAVAVIFIHDARFRREPLPDGITPEVARSMDPKDVLKRLGDMAMTIKPGEISDDPTNLECIVLYGYAPGLEPVLLNAPYERDLPGSLTDPKRGHVDKIKWMPEASGPTGDEKVTLSNIGGAIIDIARGLDPLPGPLAGVRIYTSSPDFPKED